MANKCRLLQIEKRSYETKHKAVFEVLAFLEKLDEMFASIALIAINGIIWMGEKIWNFIKERL